VFLNCFGIKQIHRYGRLKKEINYVGTITIVNLLEIKDNNQKAPMLWERVPSITNDSIAAAKISNYLNGHATNKMTIKSTPFISDSLTNYTIRTLFTELDTIKNFDTYILNVDITKAFSSIADRYILLVYQDGYHFSKEYLHYIESKRTRQALLGGLSMGTALAVGGIGYACITQYDEGYSDIGLALIDKATSKVLYFSKNSAHINPLEFSAIIKQLDLMLMKF